MLIFVTMTAMITWLTFLLLLCYVGENATNALENIHPAIYETPWQLCPEEFQKCVLFMLKAAQEPIYLKGYASLQCSRALFKQVLAKKILSILIILYLNCFALCINKILFRQSTPDSRILWYYGDLVSLAFVHDIDDWTNWLENNSNKDTKRIAEKRFRTFKIN